MIIQNYVLFLILAMVHFPHRSGRRIRKTRKYDIITTPAERVEMAPLNEENDDEDDSTLFDVKYRSEFSTGHHHLSSCGAKKPVQTQAD